MTFTEQFPALAREAAEKTYRDKSLNCAESIFKALLTSCGEECPDSLVRAATGFGRGMGGSGCSCGALTGSIMAAGVLFGREAIGEDPKFCQELSKKIHDAFRAHHRATCCRVLHNGLISGSPEQKAACAIRTGETAEIVAKILMEAAKEKENAAKAASNT